MVPIISVFPKIQDRSCITTEKGTKQKKVATLSTVFSDLKIKHKNNHTLMTYAYEKYLKKKKIMAHFVPSIYSKGF